MNNKYTSIDNAPRIYVGTYGKYNAGSIAGKWLDLEDYSDSSEFYDACKELHKDEHDPEFMFSDWENIPSNFISESSLKDEVFEWVELDEDVKTVIRLFVECHGDIYDDFEDLKNAAIDRHYGTADSEADFSEELFYSFYEPDTVPNHLVINWEATWNSYDRFGYNSVRDDETGELHFFRSE